MHLRSEKEPLGEKEIAFDGRKRETSGRGEGDARKRPEVGRNCGSPKDIAINQGKAR